MPRRNASGTFVWGALYALIRWSSEGMKSAVFACHAKTRGLRERRRSKVGGLDREAGTWRSDSSMGSLQPLIDHPLPPHGSGEGPRDSPRAFPAPYRLEARGCLIPIAPSMGEQRGRPVVVSVHTPHTLQSTGTLAKSDTRASEWKARICRQSIPLRHDSSIDHLNPLGNID